MRYRFRRWRIVLRKILRRIVFSRSSSGSIAWGVALGVFIGLTPAVGFQMILAAFLATLFGVNRLAAIVPVWISNPFTLAPIYYFNFRVGAAFLPVEKAAEVPVRFAVLAERIAVISLTDFLGTMSAALGEMGKLGADILVPLIAGSVVVGAVAAALSYPLALWSVEFVRRRRRAYAIRRAEKRLERLESEGLSDRTATGSWKPIRPRREDGEAPGDEEARGRESPEVESEPGRRPLGPIGSGRDNGTSSRDDRPDPDARSADRTAP